MYVESCSSGAVTGNRVSKERSCATIQLPVGKDSKWLQRAPESFSRRLVLVVIDLIGLMS